MENTINGNVYLDMLQNYAIPQIPQGYVFQQDGAPPHFALHVGDHLNECFPQQWIGRGGPTAWPPRSIAEESIHSNDLQHVMQSEVELRLVGKHIPAEFEEWRNFAAYQDTHFH